MHNSTLPSDELSPVKYHGQTGPEIHNHILCQINKEFWEDPAHTSLHMLPSIQMNDLYKLLKSGTPL
jgi:hypothetical protein